MLTIQPGRARDEAGFTLVEILVVVVIIGILAAIAIPSFVGQKSKALDSQAKVVARTAETAMETYATENNGTYSGATVSALNSISPSLITTSRTNAFLASVTPSGTSSYTVVASDPVVSSSFTITNSAGAVTRTCSRANVGGCSSSGTW